MRENNHLSGDNLSIFKTRADILKMRNVKEFAYSQIFRRFRGLLNHSAAVVFLKTAGFSLSILIPQKYA